MNLRDYLVDKRNSNVNRMLALTTEMVSRKDTNDDCSDLKSEYDVLDIELRILNEVIGICEKRGRF